MKEAQDTIPPLFKCPISLDLFKDPVTLCTGQTYERSNIQRWLSSGNLTCPVTMQKLQDPSFVPNNTLRHLISQWLQMADQLNPHSLSAIDSLPALTTKLQSHEFSFDYKIQILQRVRILFEEFPSCTSCFIQFGFLPVLLELVFGQVEPELSHEHEQFVEQGLDFVVAMASVDHIQSLNVLMEDSKLSRFMVLFSHGTVMIKINLCHLIEAVSSSVETRDLAALLGSKPQLLREIVLLLRNSEASDAAPKAIWSLSSLEQNINNLVMEGAVSGLITYISNTQQREGRFARVGMGAIEKLLVVKRAKEEVMNTRNGVNVIVKMVFRVSDHGGSESAVNSLVMLCYDSFEAREEAIRGGVLSQLLLLLQSQCCAKTKTKARILLKLLRSKWVEDKRNM